MANTPVVLRCVIDDVLPAAGSYVVSFSSSGVKLQAVALAPFAGANPRGVRAYGLYPPGTPVLCVFDFSAAARMLEGVILGPLPRRVLDQSLGVSDWISAFAGPTATSDLVDTHALVKYGASIHNFSCGLPLDAIPGHDAGVMQDLGIGYGIGYLEAWMRASDVAGVSFHYQDDLTRIAAYNYDFWHAGGERWIRNDQGEVTDVDAMSPYPWEALGLFSKNDGAFTRIAEGGSYRMGTSRLQYEPALPDQRGLARHVVTRGYLGDLRRTDVVLPARKSGSGNTAPAAYSDAEAHDLTGLLSVQEHRDGLYSVRSAKGIIHEKCLFIPVPRQVAVPEEGSSRGDTAGINYAPSGIGEKGGTANATQHVRPRLVYADDSRPDMWVAQMFDVHAYIFNWQSVRGYAAHAKDWVLPEEGYFAHQEDTGTASVWFGSVYVSSAPLRDTYTMALPAFADVQVDHLTKSRYYCSRSCIEQMEDGSILIEDGYGSSLMLAGGNIHLTCPGDFFVRPGRSAITWAGDDVIARAGSSVDITAGIGDVRLKAERNLHMLAGNAGVGGVLIDSRGLVTDVTAAVDKLGEESLTAGFVVRLVQGAPLVLRGSDVRIEATGVEGVRGGNVFIEAAGGSVEQRAMYHTRLGVPQTQSDVPGFSDGVVGTTGGVTTLVALNRSTYRLALADEETSAIVLAATNVGLGGEMFVDGSVSTSGGITPVDNAEAVIGGMTAALTTWVGALDGVRAETDEIRNAMTALQDVAFSYRTGAQYGTDMETFYLAEARWQRAYRQRGIGVGVIEPAVGGEYPYPGKLAWMEATRYRLVDSAMYDWSSRKARARDSGVYADADGKQAKEPASLRPVSMVGNYLVSKQEVG